MNRYKFKEGDKVRLKVKGECNNTLIRYSLAPEMKEILNKQPYIIVDKNIRGELFRSHGFHWHPRDFVLYHSELKEGGKLL